MKNIAILGGVHHKDDSREFKLAEKLAETLTRKGHQIWACGGRGVPLAAARGTSNVKIDGPDGEKVSKTAKIWTDIGDARQIPRGAANEDSYTNNLSVIVHNPDVHIFFPGLQGTCLQLTTLLMMTQTETKSSPTKIIIFTPGADEMLHFVRHFLSLTGQKEFPEFVHLLDEHVDGFENVLKLI